MHRNLCNGTYGLCSRMIPVDGTELLNYLRKVEFDGEELIYSGWNLF